MKKLVARDAEGSLRLIPTGKYKFPLLGGSLKKYPWIGYPTFWEEMTEEERDKLYAIYQEEGLRALRDAVTYLDNEVWINRYGPKSRAAAFRGRMRMEGR